MEEELNPTGQEEQTSEQTAPVFERDLTNEETQRAAFDTSLEDIQSRLSNPDISEEDKARLKDRQNNLVSNGRSRFPDVDEVFTNRENEAAAAQEEQDSTYQQGDTRKPKTNNAFQEIGTAVVGSGIDFGESIGETAERTLKGKWFDNDFPPTWLQVDDNVEPMNQTVWGRALRGIGEFGLGFAVAGGIGNLSKVSLLSKVPVVGKLANYANSTRATKLGSVVQTTVTGSTKSALVTFVTANEDSQTVGDSLREIAPWMPVITTDPEATPLENRARHVLEDIGMGVPFEFLGAFFAGRRAANRIDNNLPSRPPEEVQATTFKKLQADSKAGKFDNIKEAVRKDPGFTKPNPDVHPDYFNPPDRGVRTVPSDGGAYKALKDAIYISNSSVQRAGRRVNLISYPNVGRLLDDASSGARDIIKNTVKELDNSIDNIRGTNIGGTDYTLTEVKSLGVAKFADIMEAFPEFKDFDWEQAKKMLLEDKVVQTGSGKEFLAPQNVIALELLMTDMAETVADLGTAIVSTADAMPGNKVIMTRMLDSLEAAFVLNQESSEYAGSLLRARNWKDSAKRVPNKLTVDKRTKIKQFRQELEEVALKSPEDAKLLARMFAETNGDVRTLMNLKQYASDEVGIFKQFIVGGSQFWDAFFGVTFNSILSGSKTLLRATVGAGIATVLRPVSMIAGGALTANKTTMMKGMHALSSTFESFGESWRMATNANEALISNRDIVGVVKPASVLESARWKEIGRVINSGDDLWAQARYGMATTMMRMNNMKIFNYPQKVLTGIDIFTKTTVGRQELKMRAFDKAVANVGENGNFNELLGKYTDELYNSIFSNNGDVIDISARRIGEEAALQTPLTGTLLKIDQVTNDIPAVKPFFMFMRTGINSLDFTFKHTPLAAAYGETNAILRANPNDLSSVYEYGIDTIAKLDEAKAVALGRMAIGTATVGVAVNLGLSGRLTGNGPADYRQRKALESTNWRPRSILVGDKYINYDGLFPFNLILSTVGDIVENSNNLDETATDNLLRKVGFLITANVTNASFLQGVSNLNAMLAFQEGAGEKYVSDMLNNAIPWSSNRKELANLITPGNREIESDIFSMIAKRNPILKTLLPIDYDFLDGSVVNSYSFPTRLGQAISPITYSGKDTPTRKLLRESGFDFAPTLETGRHGYPLTAEQRSRLKFYMGSRNLEDKLAKIVGTRVAQREIAKYREARKNNITGTDMQSSELVSFRDSNTYGLMTRQINDVKDQALVDLENEFPELKEQSRDRQIRRNRQRQGDTDVIQDILNLRNK